MIWFCKISSRLASGDMKDSEFELWRKVYRLVASAMIIHGLASTRTPCWSVCLKYHVRFCIQICLEKFWARRFSLFICIKFIFKVNKCNSFLFSGINFQERPTSHHWNHHADRRPRENPLNRSSRESPPWKGTACHLPLRPCHFNRTEDHRTEGTRALQHQHRETVPQQHQYREKMAQWQVEELSLHHMNQQVGC